MAEQSTAQGIGASVRRTEDQRFITGRGRYTDDITARGQLHAVFVRSPLAHAQITAIDTREAAAAPGVVAVYTGADIAADDKVGSLPAGWLVKNKDGSDMVEPPYPLLVADRVRHVGDQVAVVIAETKQQASAAAQILAESIEYDDLPTIVATADAAADGAPQVWEQAPNNTCFDWEIGDKAATDAAFAKAHHIAKLDLVQNRLVPNAIEPRACLAEYDESSGNYTLHSTSQNPHLLRLLLSAFVLGIPEHKLRVVAPDVGGGFGSKIYVYSEEATALWAAGKLGRPVKWTADRSEAFMTDRHARDHVTHAELALDESGTFLGLRVSTIANLGAYLSVFGPSIPTYFYAPLLGGCYATPAIYAEVRAVFTNTVPVDAYRGAGRPEATFLVERLVDVAAREMNIDRVELRRRNFIPQDAFPYQTPVAVEYDSGDYHATLDLALEQSGYADFASRRTESEKRGKLRGIGMSTFVEACGIAPSAMAGALGARAGLYESAQVRVHPTGSVTVLTGSHSHGQGHETVFAQLVNEFLGVPVEQVEVVHGDTGQIPFGMGTYGSRSLAVGGVALHGAINKIIDKGKKIAAHMMEASAGDIEFADGAFTVAGTDKSLALGEVAFAAYVPHNFPHDQLEPGLDETAFYDPKNFTFPAGCHIVEVEVDPETGVVEVVGVTVADDVGRVINPMIVEGQIHGGLVQGIGQALFEDCRYDLDSGQLLTGSFMNYTMPRAADFPSFKTGNHVTLCAHNSLGVKGVGEVGSIGVPPAVINAVVDALTPLGVTHIDMPATPERVWRTITEAQSNGKAKAS
ncbi:MAG: xanthine dehydrogenase family protein molybdopterin-binding subunit [Myxococcota bacterium]